MSVTAVVAEDEEPQRRELCAMLDAEWPELRIVAQCTDGLSALEALASHRPQVLFLDIRMPGVSGLEVARAAAGMSQIVFATAYEEYAVQAFERGAIDYLLKPIKRDRFTMALNRVRERLAQGLVPDISAVLNSLQQQLESNHRGSIQWITASIGNSVRMFPIGEILFFQAQEKYTRVVTATDEAHIRTPLKDLIGNLDENTFWQIHRSAIVRANAIHSVRREPDGRLMLSIRGRGDELPVSQSFQYRFKGM